MNSKMQLSTVLVLDILLGTISTSQANPTMDKDTACKLNVLLSNCSIGRDKKAPAYMRTGGPASCFVGVDVTPKGIATSPFNKIITEEKYTRKGLEEEITEIKNCLVNIEALRNCNIGYSAAGLVKNVKACQ